MIQLSKCLAGRHEFRSLAPSKKPGAAVCCRSASTGASGRAGEALHLVGSPPQLKE